jgi:hypothetical protein
VIVNEGVNESNHPIQNPLLLVTEPRTRDNIHSVVEVNAFPKLPYIGFALSIFFKLARLFSITQAGLTIATRSCVRAASIIFSTMQSAILPVTDR